MLSIETANVHGDIKVFSETSATAYADEWRNRNWVDRLHETIPNSRAEEAYVMFLAVALDICHIVLFGSL